METTIVKQQTSILDDASKQLQALIDCLNKKRNRNLYEPVFSKITFETDSPALLVSLGKLLKGKVKFDKKTSCIEIEQMFTREQYEKVIVPICAAFNITNIPHGRIILGRVK